MPPPAASGIGKECANSDEVEGLILRAGSPEHDDDTPKAIQEISKHEPKPTSQAGQTNAGIKTFVLVFLVVQNSAASLLMRLSRANQGEVAWNPQTGVIVQEVVKALSCVALLLQEGNLFTAFDNRAEALKTGVPAILYLVQNNLQYVAVTYLDASTYAVLYQLKIITTALLSVAILGKQLSCVQWVALVLLTSGVSTVVLSQMSGQKKEDHTGQSPSILLGLAAVLAACVTSGLAGVSFEYLLKGSTMSLWARNLQLALYSTVVGLFTFYGSGSNTRTDDSGSSHPASFFQGYTMWVWLAVLNNALGGLLIAAVIKYADNILKNFSTSLSIILTAAVSVVALDSSLDALFGLGTAMVIYAVFLYGAMNPVVMLMDLLRGPQRQEDRPHLELEARKLKSSEVAGKGPGGSM